MNKEKVNVEKRNYNVLDAFKFFFFLVITYFAMSILLVVVLFIVASSMGISYVDFAQYEGVQVISYILPPVTFIAYFLIYNKAHHIKNSFALSDGQKISLLPISIAIVLAIICIFLFTPFMNLVEYLFMTLGYFPDNTIPLADKMKSSFSFFGIGLLIYALLPAIAEELIFRGVIQNALLTKYRGFVAIFFSTIFFVLLHGSLQQTVYQMVVGIMLGYLACVGGSILYSIILHFLNNALVLAFSCFDIVGYLSSDYTVYYNIYSMIFPVCIFLLGLALTAILFWVLKYLRNKNFFRFDSTITKRKRSKKKQEVVEVKKPGLRGFWQGLAYNEKIMFISSIILVGLVWLINTINGFMVA